MTERKGDASRRPTVEQLLESNDDRVVEVGHAALALEAAAARLTTALEAVQTRSPNSELADAYVVAHVTIDKVVEQLGA